MRCRQPKYAYGPPSLHQPRSEVLNIVGILVNLANSYRFKTKGEMLFKECQDQASC